MDDKKEEIIAVISEAISCFVQDIIKEYEQRLKKKILYQIQISTQLNSDDISCTAIANLKKYVGSVLS